ncbi:MAG: hypothetical protein HY323_09300 [Betaproteobacteria bacterium]|nr:hypothetical protein [Betaproteobacteria bacterium]
MGHPDQARVTETPGDESLSRVTAARDLLRLERRIARVEAALRLLLAHRERLVRLLDQEGGAA